MKIQKLEKTWKYRENRIKKIKYEIFKKNIVKYKIDIVKPVNIERYTTTKICLFISALGANHVMLYIVGVHSVAACLTSNVVFVLKMFNI